MILSFEGDTLTDIKLKIRAFLAERPDDGVDGLVSLDGPLPPAVKKTSKRREGEPTLAQLEAGRAAQAAPCTRDDVRASVDRYIVRFGLDHAAIQVPRLMGAALVRDIPEGDLWRAKAALDAAVARNDPAGGSVLD